MAMTKEQIIREMIQIELLYQTRRHLKKLNESNTPTTNKQYNFSNNFKNTFIKDVDFGNYKYETEALKNVKVIVVSDWVDYQSFRSSSGVLTNTAVGG